jgi:mannose-6-phosphate isomerase-like protein (cupin superfamily)
MRVAKISDSIGGWFIGNFDKAAYRTSSFEVSYKEHSKGEMYGWHYHQHLDEINLVVSGKIKIHGQVFGPGDIFILEPYDVADPEFLEDCKIVCVKAPNITNDKVDLRRNDRD